MKFKILKDLHLQPETRAQLAKVAILVDVAFWAPIGVASFGLLTLLIHISIVVYRWFTAKVNYKNAHKANLLKIFSEESNFGPLFLDKIKEEEQ